MGKVKNPKKPGSEVVRVLRALGLPWTSLASARAAVGKLRVDSQTLADVSSQNASLSSENTQLRKKENQLNALLVVLNEARISPTPDGVKYFIDLMRRDMQALRDELSKTSAELANEKAARREADAKAGTLTTMLNLANNIIDALAARVDELVRHIAELGVQRVILAGDSAESKLLRNMFNSVADNDVPPDWLVESPAVIAALQNAEMATDQQAKAGNTRDDEGDDVIEIEMLTPDDGSI